MIKDDHHLEEFLAQAKALEAYLRGRELQRPMLGAQRRIEGRIGQLLGVPESGGRGKTHTHADTFTRDGDRVDFRLLARALSGDCALTDDEWQKSRRDHRDTPGSGT